MGNASGQKFELRGLIILSGGSLGALLLSLFLLPKLAGSFGFELGIWSPKWEVFGFILAIFGGWLLVGAAYVSRESETNSVLLNFASQVLISVPLFMFGIVYALLPFVGVWQTGLNAAWSVSLFFPAAVGLALGYTVWPLWHGKDETDEENEPTSLDDPRRQEDTSEPSDHFVYMLYYGTIQAGYWAFIILAIGIGAALFTLLKMIAFEEAVLQIDKLFGVFAAVVQAVLPNVMAILVVIGGLYIGLGVIVLLLKMWERRHHPDANRGLSKRELDFVETGEASLAQYLVERKFPPDWAIAYMLAGVSVFVMGAVLATGTWFALQHVSSLAEATRAEGGEVLLYFNTGIGSVIFAVLAGCGLVWSATQAFGTIHRDVGIYLAGKQAWNSMSNPSEAEANINRALERAVRREEIQTTKPLDPGAFIHAQFRRNECVVYWMTAIFAVLTAVFFWLDVRAFTQFSQTGVRHQGYFAAQEFQLEYADVQAAEYSCYTYRDDGKTRLGTRYTIVLNDDHEIGLLGTYRETRKRIDRVLQIDEYLTEAGVPIRADEVVEDCKARVLDRFGPADSDKLLRLFRVE